MQCDTRHRMVSASESSLRALEAVTNHPGPLVPSILLFFRREGLELCGTHDYVANQGFEPGDYRSFVAELANVKSVGTASPIDPCRNFMSRNFDKTLCVSTFHSSFSTNVTFSLSEVASLRISCDTVTWRELCPTS